MCTPWRSRNWLLFILFLCHVIPILSQPNTTNTTQQNDCTLPLASTQYDSVTDHDGCALYCDSHDAATPLTNRVTNKYITLTFLGFLIPAFICNLIFTFNNISEHRENEETFQSTPITYDSLFVIDAAYLVIIVCLIIPSLSFFDGGNTVDALYICNSNEDTLSMHNPTTGSNALCTILGLGIFTGFKVILIYTGITCVNIWYRLWKPMVDVGIQKRYIHGCALTLVLLLDIIILGLGAIEANPSNGMCYLPMSDTVLLLTMDIIPNILFVIVSILSVAHATKQLKLELRVIQQADLVVDDLANLVHRLTGFLLMSVAGSVFVVFTEIVWVIAKDMYDESMREWIVCAQMLYTESVKQKWKYQIGDQCVQELQDEGYMFPNAIFFIAFPIAALFSSIGIIILTCHRRQYGKWSKAGHSIKSVCHKLSLIRLCTPKMRPSESQVQSLIETSNKSNGSTVALKPSRGDLELVPTKSPSATEPNENDTDDVRSPALSVSVHEQNNSENDVEALGTVRYNENKPDTNMSFAGDTPTMTGTDLPGFESGDHNSNTMIRHPTDSKADTEDLDGINIEDYEHKVLRQQTLENQNNQLSVNEQTEMLIELDKQRSLKTGKLEHIANVSFDYHNLTSKQGKTGLPLTKMLAMESYNSNDITVGEEDLNKSEAVTARLQTLELTKADTKRDSTRSKTLPNLVKRTSTQKNFLSFLDEAIQNDLLKKNSKSTKSVRWIDDDSRSNAPITPKSPNESEHTIAEKAADVILRSATDSLVKKVKDETDVGLQKKRKQRRELKKSQTSLDPANAIGMDFANTESKDDEEFADTHSSQPEIGDRRLSQQQRKNLEVKQVTDRHKKNFLNTFGRRKAAKQIKKFKARLRKKNTVLRFADEFKLSNGTNLFTGSTLLKPVTMESQYNIDTELYFDESRTTTTFSTQSSFDISQDTSVSNNNLDVLIHHSQQQTMQWQSMQNIFHFTLTDKEWKQTLHSTFTPMSTRKSKRMTFDENEPFGSGSVAIDENTETNANARTQQTQSMNDLKNDRSVTGIGSDGRLVLSDVGRFKKIGSHASSVPLHEKSGNNLLSEEKEYEYEDVKHDRSIKRSKSHHRTETLHGRLLDAVPHADRQDLEIVIHPDFSCQVAEKRKRHYKAETAKLAFTLKPVHSMKILL